MAPVGPLRISKQVQKQTRQARKTPFLHAAWHNLCAAHLQQLHCHSGLRRPHNRQSGYLVKAGAADQPGKSGEQAPTRVAAPAPAPGKNAVATVSLVVPSVASTAADSASSTATEGGSSAASSAAKVASPGARDAAHGTEPPPLAADVPTHPLALRYLSVLYLCSCALERSWRFLFPISLLAVSPSDTLTAMSLVSLASSLATALTGPLLGRLLDKVWRPYGLATLLVVQDLCIACKAALLATSPPGVALTQQTARFGLLVVCCCLEKLAAIASELEVERNWVTRLAGKTNVVSLANSNSWLRRADLVCEAVGAFAFSAFTLAHGTVAALTATVVLGVAVIPIQLHFIAQIARLAPEAMLHGKEEWGMAMVKPPQWHTFLRAPRRQQQTQEEQRAQQVQRARPLLHRLRDQATQAMASWRVYTRQPILPSSLTFCILFCNVMLSPGTLIVALLDANGFTNQAHAMFRFGCATMGFIGTWVGKRMITALGLLRAGRSALLFHATMLAVAAAVYARWLQPAAVQLVELGGGNAPLASGLTIGGVPLGVAAFATCVVVSRVGLWAIDMVNSQLFQVTVRQREMASASTTEMALCSMAEVCMLAVAARSASPSSYPVLVYGSLTAVITATVLFSLWARQAQPSIDSAMLAAA